MTQEELAARLEVTAGLVSHYEKGVRSIPPERAIDIEARLGGAVTRYDLRPDIFGEMPAPKAGPWDGEKQDDTNSLSAEEAA